MSDRYLEPETTRLPAAVPPPCPGDSPVPDELAPGRRPGIWRREAAVICDALVLWVVGYLLGRMCFNQLARLGPWGRLVGFAIALSYFAILNSRIGGGRTLGKRLVSIQVLALDGSPLPLSRSVVRYLVLGTPYFLNNLAVPVTRVPFFLLTLASTLIFYGYGATVYLYLFNRRTRRSLHDFAAGSIVVRSEPGTLPSGRLWKGHLVILGVLYIGLAAATAFLAGMPAMRGQLERILQVAEAVESTDAVQSAQVMGSTLFRPGGGRVNILNVAVILKERPDSYEKASVRIAGVVLAADPFVRQVDAMGVGVAYGYDIGISKRYESRYTSLPPEQWRSLVAEKTPPPGVASSEGLSPSQETAPPSCEEGSIAYGGTCGVTNPVLIKESRLIPRYPAEARRERVQGQVILQATVTEEGAVTDIRPLRSPDPRLTKAAIDAVGMWRYRPGRKDGKPVPVYFTIVVDFVLNPGA